MAAHAGLFRFDAHGPERSEVENLLSEVAEFAAGTALVRMHDGVAAVSCTSARDLEGPEQHVHESPQGSIVVWDGRLDNLSDLDFQMPTRQPLGDHPEAQLALAVYERWGVQGFERLLGDWRDRKSVV